MDVRVGVLNNFEAGINVAGEVCRELSADEKKLSDLI
jgi:hypothetical protein